MLGDRPVTSDGFAGIAVSIVRAGSWEQSGAELFLPLQACDGTIALYSTRRKQFVREVQRFQAKFDVHWVKSIQHPR